MNLFTLSAKLELDTSEYERGTIAAAKGGEELKRKISDVSDEANKAGDSFGNLNQSFNVFKGIVQASIFQKVSGALVDIASDSIEVASNLSEVQNVVDVTFGKDSGKIDRWAKTANRSFGLTELQAKKFTSTLGAMMKSSGLAGDAVTEMSVNLSGLAADMASFYNLDYDQAFEKIRSGISGETEPLKQLGINMSVANLEAYAMTQGITKAFDKMSQAEQVQLRYNYLMQATADAQGDFARTSDGYANSVRTLQGNIETLKGRLGEIMLPLLEEAAGLGNQLLDKLIPEATLSGQIEEIKTDYNEKLEDITGTQEDVSFLVGKLEELGDRAGLTADEQERWQAICSKLVETLPGLSSIINTQTGEIKGGTTAIIEYTKAWADNAKQQALTTAMEDANSALGLAMSEAAKAEVALKLSEDQLNRLYEKRAPLMKRLAEAAGYTQDEIAQMLSDPRLTASLDRNLFGMIDDENAALKEEFNAVQGEILEQTVLVEDLTRANNEAQANLQEGQITWEKTTESLARLNEQYGVNAEVAQEDGLQTATLTQLFSDFEAAAASLEAQMKEADAYRTAMLESTRAQIEQTVSGFSQIGLGELAANFKEDITSMTLGLQDQAKFMEEYGANLKEAAAKGVDEGLLATLSDGSKESALYLQQIVSGTEGDIASLNAAWLDVQEGKETFTQALADQKLEADTQYDAIIAKTDEMVANLDQKTTAYNNAASTASGITEGLLSQQDSIDSAIATLNGKLSALGAWTIGNVPRITTEASFSTSKNAHGLDYVPTNDYPAWLHKGEAVLTRNEAEAWRAIQSEPRASAGIDLDALAGVIVSAMGGVTLQMDRRTVGQVIAPVVSEEIAREARMRRGDL